MYKKIKKKVAIIKDDYCDFMDIHKIEFEQLDCEQFNSEFIDSTLKDAKKYCL